MRKYLPNMHGETLQTAINEAQVCSYLLSARNPPVTCASCTFMVSILSLSLRMLLMKSALASRWPSRVSCSSFYAAENRFNQSETWAVGVAATVPFRKATHKAARSRFLYFYMETNLAECIFGNP